MSVELIKSVRERDEAFEGLTNVLTAEHGGDRERAEQTVHIFKLWLELSPERRGEALWVMAIIAGDYRNDLAGQLITGITKAREAGKFDEEERLRAQVSKLYQYERTLNGGRKYSVGGWK